MCGHLLHSLLYPTLIIHCMPYAINTQGKGQEQCVAHSHRFWTTCNWPIYVHLGKGPEIPKCKWDHLRTSCPKHVTHNADLIKFTLRITALSMWWPALVGYVYCTKFTSFVLTAFTYIRTQLQRNRISITSAMPHVCDSGAVVLWYISPYFLDGSIHQFFLCRMQALFSIVLRWTTTHHHPYIDSTTVGIGGLILYSTSQLCILGCSLLGLSTELKI